MRVSSHLHIRRHKAGFPACLSVKQPGEPMRYAATLLLKNATFTVGAAGLRRFRATGQKNVHAWVRGELLDEYRFIIPPADMYTNGAGWKEIRYNPVNCDSFQTLDGQPVKKAERVVMIRNKIYAKNPRS